MSRAATVALPLASRATRHRGPQFRGSGERADSGVLDGSIKEPARRVRYDPNCVATLPLVTGRNSREALKGEWGARVAALATRDRIDAGAPYSPAVRPNTYGAAPPRRHGSPRGSEEQLAGRLAAWIAGVDTASARIKRHQDHAHRTQQRSACFPWRQYRVMPIVDTARIAQLARHDPGNRAARGAAPGILFDLPHNRSPAPGAPS